MALDVGALLLGCVFLYFGAEWLIKGAAGLAAGFGIKPLVIGLTVVAYGTSMPELVVSSVSALGGKGAIALGNVVGSNIANIGLILGITALISPPKVEGGLLRRELLVLGMTALALPLVLADGVVSRVEAGLLLFAAFAFTGWVLRVAKPGEAESAVTAEVNAEIAGAPAVQGRAREAGVALIGLVLLVLGGKTFVTGATGIATALGVSDRIIGLTIVAVGTSLPELAASVIAALRGHSEIAVGNVIGSNIFNVLLIVGGAGLLRPLHVSAESVQLDMVVLAAATLLAIVLLRTARSVNRIEGGVLVAGYAGFLVLLSR